MFPIILIMFVVTFLFNAVGSMVNRTTSQFINFGEDDYFESNVNFAEVEVDWEGVQYDEATFQDYANTRYEEEFSESNAYEDNLLIVFLTNEAADGYYTIAWVGDNICNEINYMFGNEETEFGEAMISSINDSYYAYSLDSNLASVMEIMTGKVAELNLDTSFKSENNNDGAVESHVTNYTDFDVTEDTVNAALQKFTEETGIPTVIVIDSMESVFGYYEYPSSSEDDDVEDIENTEEVENEENTEHIGDIENTEDMESFDDSEHSGSFSNSEQPVVEKPISVQMLIIISLVIILIIIIITLIVSARKRKQEDDDFAKYNSRTYDE